LVNTWNGNLFYPVKVLSIPSRGLPVEILLSYNSSWHDHESSYGYGWQFSYNTRYSREQNGDIVVVRHDGRTDRFIKENGAFVSPEDIYDTLKEYLPGKYVLRNKQGRKLFFDSPVHKRLTRIQDNNGNTLSLFYNTNLLLTAIIDASGRHVNLTYSNEKLHSIKDFNNRIFQLQYDGDNNLIRIINPVYDSVSYGYDTDHFLTSITDAMGNNTVISYSDKATAGINTSLSSHTLTYDTVNRITTVKYGDQTTKYYYNSNSCISTIEDPFGNQVSMVWDDDNNMTDYTDENGHTTSYTYDNKGNVLTNTNALNNVTAYTYESSYNRITSITDANNYTTSFTYDTLDNLTHTIRYFQHILYLLPYKANHKCR